MNGCSALRLLLICILCMAPSASMHVNVYPRALGGLHQATNRPSILHCMHWEVVGRKWCPSPPWGVGVTWRQPPPPPPPRVGGKRRLGGMDMVMVGVGRWYARAGHRGHTQGTQKAHTVSVYCVPTVCPLYVHVPLCPVGVLCALYASSLCAVCPLGVL